MYPNIQLPSIDTGVFDFNGRSTTYKATKTAPTDWKQWLTTLFPSTFKYEFADRQIEFWKWIDNLELDVKPSPSAFFAIWPRGSGKTTSAETAVTYLGAKKKRSFALYVRSSQDKANESVNNIGARIESTAVETYYPQFSKRKLSKYGHSKGWRMDMLRCANGFNVLALGLDAAIRGVKLEDYRPDLIIFDDIDHEHDTNKTIQKKIDIITKSILPAGSSNCAYLGMQNLIHANSIFSQIVNNEVDFLVDRKVSGPHPAISEATYKARSNGKGYEIESGTPTWVGQDLTICQSQIDDWGITAFRKEAQQEVEENGGIWEHIEFNHTKYEELPDLVHGEVWCDPAISKTDDSDNNGIAAGGISSSGDVYVMFSWEQLATPLEVLKKAILKCIELKFTTVGAETDQGGDTWKSVYYQAWREILEDEDISIIDKDTAVMRGIIDNIDENQYFDAFHYLNDEWIAIKRPRFKSAKAGAGHGSKIERNQRMLADYERGRVYHVTGTHTAVERALKRFPNKPLDLADALYWLWVHLIKKRSRSRIG